MSASITEIKRLLEKEEVSPNQLSKVITACNFLRCSSPDSVIVEGDFLKLIFTIDYAGSGLKNYHGDQFSKSASDSLKNTLSKVKGFSEAKINLPKNKIELILNYQRK